MAPKAQRQERIFIAAVFIILEIAAIAMLYNASTLHNSWLNRLCHSAIANVWRPFQRVENYFSLKEENRILSEQNTELLSRVTRYQDLASRNTELAMADQRFDYVNAKVVKMNHNTQHNHIILDKGSADGIRPLDAIVISSGAVGIIDAVSEHLSYGLLFTNANMSVSAKVSGSGVTATLVWDGRRMNGGILHGIPLGSNVQKADTVWTSGLSGLYPAGIPLGVVENLHTSDGASLEASVKLFTDFKSIDYVSIACDRLRDELQTLEQNR